MNVLEIDIGAELREMRVQKGLTQQDVADLFHTSRERINRIENNKQDLKAREYLEMAYTLAGVKKLASFQFNWRPKEGARI